jgi:hypothetical protein
MDLDRIADRGAKLVLTLLEDHELTLLRIQNLGHEVLRRNIECIPDVSAPTAHFDNEWPAQSERLRKTLRDGANIVIHCRGGIGRAGMVATRLLVELGDAPDVAIRQGARGPAPESYRDAGSGAVGGTRPAHDASRTRSRTRKPRA